MELPRAGAPGWSSGVSWLPKASPAPTVERSSPLHVHYPSSPSELRVRRLVSRGKALHCCGLDIPRQRSPLKSRWSYPLTGSSPSTDRALLGKQKWRAGVEIGM